MTSNINSYEISILKSIFLSILYLTVGLIVPTAFNTLVWRPYGGGISAWLNIATLIIINIGFFIVLARITQYKVIIFTNISLKNTLLAAVCSVFFYLILDNFLDPIFDKLFPSSAVEYQETLKELRQFPIHHIYSSLLICSNNRRIVNEGIYIYWVTK